MQFQPYIIAKPQDMWFEEEINFWWQSVAPDFSYYCRDINLHGAVISALPAGEAELQFFIDLFMW